MIKGLCIIDVVELLAVIGGFIDTICFIDDLFAVWFKEKDRVGGMLLLAERYYWICKGAIEFWIP